MCLSINVLFRSFELFVCGFFTVGKSHPSESEHRNWFVYTAKFKNVCTSRCFVLLWCNLVCYRHRRIPERDPSIASCELSNEFIDPTRYIERGIYLKWDEVGFNGKGFCENCVVLKMDELADMNDG